MAKKEIDIYDVAEIKIDNMRYAEAVQLTTRLAELGYDTTSEGTYDGSEEYVYKVYGRKRYVVNNDPAETRLFKKVIDTFHAAVQLLIKGNGITIEIDHSVGAIDISVTPRNQTV